MKQYNINDTLPKPLLIFRLVRIFPFLLIFKFIRNSILKQIEYKNNIKINSGFYCVVGKNIHCGENVNLNDTKVIDYGEVYIGNNVKFSGENLILTSTHSINDFDIVNTKNVIIEDNVWITYRCIILPGVKIGKNSVIGAGSVVTKDIPSDVIAGGNPCKVIKNITNKS